MECLIIGGRTLGASLHCTTWSLQMPCSFFSQALRWLLTLTPLTTITPLTPNDNTPQGIRLDSLTS